MHKWLLSFCLLLLAACGSASGEFSDTVPTQSTPFLTRTSPTDLQVNDTATIFGLGFSIVPEENVILLGEQEILAETYDLVDPFEAQNGEVEKITFTVPANAAFGMQNLLVTVLENESSNALNVNVSP